MSLSLVAMPIGNWDDISLRALRTLKEADIIIGEEAKVARRYLAHYQLKEKIKTLHFLNEHSQEKEIQELVKLCKTKKVAFISDCGSPSFCDPGFELVRECRKEKILLEVLPGPSALSTLLSHSSKKIESFNFLGFLPRDKDKRKDTWQEIAANRRCQIIMDTPYRLQISLKELKEHLSNREICLALDLTKDSEWVYDGKVKDLALQNTPKKAEFILLIYSES